MTNDQTAVLDWMRKAGQECPNEPTIPSLEIRKLRARLILEEALETIKALGILLCIRRESLEAGDVHNPKVVQIDEAHDADLSELSDGLADLQVVTIGTAVACGIDLEPVFDEVMRSNNSKWWGANEIDYGKFPEYSFKPIGDGLYCATDKGGKIRKSPAWSEPQLAPILAAMTITKRK